MQDLLVDDSAEALCNDCARATRSIRWRVHSRTDASDSIIDLPIFLGSVNDIQVNKDTCSLCKLVNHALIQSWPKVPVKSKASRSMFSPDRETNVVLVPAERLNAFGEKGSPNGWPLLFHVEIMLEDIRPIEEDMGPSGGVTQVRDMAGYIMYGFERSFQPEIRLLKPVGAGETQERNQVGSVREVGLVCPSDRLRGWYRSCVSNPSHDKTCAATRIISDSAFETPKGHTAPPPVLIHGTRLIDVHTMKLVLARQMLDPEYAALSYVWGDKDIKGLHTTKTNLEERHRDDSLSAAPLPKTISDAVTLARDLDIRYLWVDALCVVQDGGGEKDAQIEAMDKIYGLASLVFIAAAGANSHAGLVGFRTTPRPATVCACGDRDEDRGQFIADIQDLRLAVSPPPLKDILAASTWHTRGWTYQEWRFARRSLIFTATQVYFLCGSTSFSEDLALELKTGCSSPAWCGSARRDRHAVHSEKLKDNELGVSDGWMAYVEAVEDFSSRSVKNPIDTLKAFTGTLWHLHRATRNRFVAGVSIGLFHDALLWVPVVGHVDHVAKGRVSTRATTSEDINGWRTGGRTLPTWAWAEWDGAVNYGVIPSGENLVEEFNVIFIEPTLGIKLTQLKEDLRDEKQEDLGDEKQEQQNQKDSTSPAKTKSNFLRRIVRGFKKESRSKVLTREIAELQRKNAEIRRETSDLRRRKSELQRETAQLSAQRGVLHATLLGRPLAEPQTGRPAPEVIYHAKRPQLYGDEPADGAEAEAKRAGRPLHVDGSLNDINSLSLEDDSSGQLLQPIHSQRCMLSFKATFATVQIAPVLNDLIGRADGILDLDGRYIGVALLDQPGTPETRMAFYNIDVIALSYSKFPTRYAVQGAFLSPAGVREGEESEWIGLLIVGKAEPKNVEGGQHNQGSESREVFFRIGVAQVFKKAWDTWVEKRCKEILLI